MKTELSWLLPVWMRQKVQTNPVVRNIIGNSSWLFFDKILRMVVGLFLTVSVARYLGPARFGLLDFAIACVALFSAFASLGLDNIVVRELVREPQRRDEILASALVMKLVAGVATIIVVLAVILLLRNDDPYAQLLVAIVAIGLVFQSFDVIDFWFQSQVLSKFAVYARSASFVLISCIKVALLLTQAPLEAFALATMAESALTAAGLVLVYRLNGYEITMREFSMARCRAMLSDSWPVIVSCMSIMLYMRIDQVMLGEMAGSEAVGIYSAAVRLSEIWCFVPMIIVSSVFPSIIKAKSQDEAAYQRLIARLFSLMTALALTIAVTMTFLADGLVVLIYGSSYAASGPVLALHIWASWFVFLGIAQDPWDVAENLTRLAMFRTMAGAVLNILLNLVLIPHYGSIGAATATLISYAVSNLFLNAFSAKTREIFWVQLRSSLFLRHLSAQRDE